jgi:hypothetical protein
MEEATESGRSDLSFKWNNEAYILELKLGTAKNADKKGTNSFNSHNIKLQKV